MAEMFKCRHHPALQTTVQQRGQVHAVDFVNVLRGAFIGDVGHRFREFTGLMLLTVSDLKNLAGWFLELSEHLTLHGSCCR